MLGPKLFTPATARTCNRNMGKTCIRVSSCEDCTDHLISPTLPYVVSKVIVFISCSPPTAKLVSRLKAFFQEHMGRVKAFSVRVYSVRPSGVL